MQSKSFSRNCIAGALLAFLYSTLPAATDPAASIPLPVERYALYVASNNGGEKREMLKYAGTDAERLARTMNDIGGIKAENSLILTDPTKEEINGAFRNFKAIIRQNTGKSRRTEFLFYYSGHSDENAFLLGNESYDYTALKAALNQVPTDVHVVMLDSCFSGNFVRAKGGSREKAFLMDDSAIVQGHAYLSSSADNEASQESDTIQASYFTHALVSGLRGAADSSGDGKVSLNELYYYAFNATLSSTELSTIGPQHPSYNITLVGSGDLVLTDISEAEASLYLPANNEGKYFFRNKDNQLVSEINKLKGTEIALALPAGFYSVTLISGTTTKQRNLVLVKGDRTKLEEYTFVTVGRTAGRSRGDEAESNDPIVWTPFSLVFFPGFAFPSPAATENVNVSIGLLFTNNKRINGLQVSGFSGSVSKDLRGVQAAGFMNNSSGDIYGGQAAGFMNNASGDISGIQMAGFMNNLSGGLSGVQSAGFMNNASGNTKGVQAAGFMNNSDGGFTGVQASGFMNNSTGSFKGVQMAGFLNNAGGGLNGLQAAGFLNISTGSGDGAQLSGFLNIANEISGVQMGVFNFARKNTGASIGFFNIILEGIISPAVYIDSDRNAFVQYQGGTPMFYTTFLAGTSMDFNSSYGIFGFGIGSKAKLSREISFDLELIGKQIFDYKEMEAQFTEPTTKEEEKEMAERFGKYLGERWMPSIRATANYSFFSHLGVFVSVNADIQIIGYNDAAFTYGQKEAPRVLKKDEVQIYPSVAFGVKF